MIWPEEVLFMSAKARELRGGDCHSIKDGLGVLVFLGLGKID